MNTDRSRAGANDWLTPQSNKTARRCWLFVLRNVGHGSMTSVRNFLHHQISEPDTCLANTATQVSGLMEGSVTVPWTRRSKSKNELSEGGK